MADGQVFERNFAWAVYRGYSEVSARLGRVSGALRFVVLCDSANPTHNGFLVPGQSAKGEYHSFLFNMLGLEFVLAVGKQIPDSVRQYCFVRSTRQLVFVSGAVSKLILRKGGEAVKSGRVHGKLRKTWGLPPK